MPFARNSPAVRKLIAVALAALTSIVTTGALSTCGAPAGSAVVLDRTLPEKPDWARAVSAPRPPDGTDLEEVAKILDNTNQANAGRLWCFGQWYAERRREYAGAAPGRYPASCPAE